MIRNDTIRRAVRQATTTNDNVRYRSISGATRDAAESLRVPPPRSVIGPNCPNTFRAMCVEAVEAVEVPDAGGTGDREPLVNRRIDARRREENGHRDN